MTSANRNINRWRAFAVLAVAYFMTVVDLTIVNTALPTIGRDLHFSATNLQCVATAYALIFTHQQIVHTFVGAPPICSAAAGS